MEIYFIRHGMTKGNRERRYIGKTDEPLCEDGKRALGKKRYPQVERVFVSPMLRCRETAAILYPHQKSEIIEELAECDFGLFEGKNVEELEHLQVFQEWMKSGGTLPFPGGESRETFGKRCLKGFERVLQSCRERRIEQVALVVHGGTIMSVLEAVGRPKKAFYDYHVGNGEGYQLTMEEPFLSSGKWRRL